MNDSRPQIALQVTRAEPAAERVRAMSFRAVRGSLPVYEPGAHVELLLPDGDTRPYSLIDWDGDAAAPAAYHLGVLLEVESKGGSRFVHQLRPGDSVHISAPKNSFALAEGDDPALLVAGGIGVTPLISMAAALQARGVPYRLVYAARSAEAMAFRAELEARHGNALTLHFDDQAGGPLDLSALMRQATPGTHLYVCGPRPMIEAAREAALKEGFASDHIHFELFEKAVPKGDDRPFEVELASSGQVYTIPPGKTIIEVLEAEGIDVMYDCQRGDCGICQTEVLEGVPDHRDVVLSEAERAAGKVMQICVSRAKSARLKLDL